MKTITITARDMKKIRELYEGIIGNASHGLFCQEGQAIAETIFLELEGQEITMELIASKLKELGWAEDILFADEEVDIVGSPEAAYSNKTPTCHRMRGILRVIYEKKTNCSVKVVEKKCAAQGNDKCVFSVEKVNY